MRALTLEALALLMIARPALAVEPPRSAAPSSDAALPRSDDDEPIGGAPLPGSASLDDPEAEPGAYDHDGFYFRFGVGAAQFRDNAEDELGSEQIRTGAMLGEIAIGGTPAPGLVVGGASMGATAFSPKLRRAIAPASIDAQGLNYGVIGPIVDYYVDPRLGFHVELLVGLSTLSAVDSRSRQSLAVATGVGGVLGVGYEFFIDREWSVGPLLRVMLSRVSSDGATHDVLVPGALITLTYH